MRNINVILDSIKILKGFKRDMELAKLLGVRPSVISTWRKRNTVPYKQLIQLCEEESLNISCLLYGQGPIRFEKKGLSLVGPEMTPYKGEMVEIDVFALAGAGQPRDLVGPEPIKTITLPKEFLKPGIVPVMIQGESMEPNLYNGAVVGVDEKDRQVISGKVYAVWLDYEGAVVKRVYVEPDKIVLKSDNPGFPESHLDIKNISDGFILGRVKWVIQKL
jgi:SOS-response transcriptional repressor LexA